MGFFRGGAVLILSVLLFLSLLSMNSLFVLQSSLKYENVKGNLYPLLTDISSGGGLIEDEITSNFNLTQAAKNVSMKVQAYCSTRPNATYSFSYGGNTIEIPCTTDFTNPDNIINQTYYDVINDTYYKEYDCNFWNCFSTNELPFFLVSQKARDYWKNQSYYLVIASLVIVALLFLFLEEKKNILILVGFLLAISAFPLLKLDDVFSFVADQLSTFSLVFLSSAPSVFLISLIAGLILMITGIALRVTTSDLTKKKFSLQDVKDIVKTELLKKDDEAGDKKIKKK